MSPNTRLADHAIRQSSDVVRLAHQGLHGPAHLGAGVVVLVGQPERQVTLDGDVPALARRSAPQTQMWANRKLRDGVEPPMPTACGFAFPRSGHITRVLVSA